MEQLNNAEISIEPGKEQGEFAVFVDDFRVFSRLEKLRFPEAGEILEICSQKR